MIGCFMHKTINRSIYLLPHHIITYSKHGIHIIHNNYYGNENIARSFSTFPPHYDLKTIKILNGSQKVVHEILLNIYFVVVKAEHND